MRSVQAYLFYFSFILCNGANWIKMFEWVAKKLSCTALQLVFEAVLQIYTVPTQHTQKNVLLKLQTQ